MYAFLYKNGIVNNFKPSKQNVDNSRQVFQSNSINRRSISAFIDKKRCLPNTKLAHWAKSSVYYNYRAENSQKSMNYTNFMQVFFLLSFNSFHSNFVIRLCISYLEDTKHILSNLFKVKYYVISQHYVLSL